MNIIVDTREQSPWSFRGLPINKTVKGLKAGDYSVEGYEAEILIERKSIDDLVGTLIHGRERFEKECLKLRRASFAVVLVEASLSSIFQKKYHSRVDPNAVVGSCIAFQSRFDLPFIFCDNRTCAQQYAYRFFKLALKEIEDGPT